MEFEEPLGIKFMIKSLALKKLFLIEEKTHQCNKKSLPQFWFYELILEYISSTIY